MVEGGCAVFCNSRVGFTLLQVFTTLLIVTFSWISCWSILGDSCLPFSNIFGILVSCICGKLLGYLASLIRIPSLIGMIAAGIILRNVPVINIASEIDVTWSSALRTGAFVILLLRAGLGLQLEILRNNKLLVACLSVLPCVVEVAVIALLSRPLLHLPWKWAFLLGFVIAGVSPAVVIPSMLALIDSGYGHRVPTLLIAAATADNAFTITGFSVALSFVFPEQDTSLVMTVMKGPLEVAIGGLCGLVLGLILSRLPPSTPTDNPASTQTDRLAGTQTDNPAGTQTDRLAGTQTDSPASTQTDSPASTQTLLLLVVGVSCVFGLKRLSYAGAGVLATLVMAAVAAQTWGAKSEISGYLQTLWTVGESLLFTLVGAQVQLDLLNYRIIGYGLLSLVIGVAVRCFVAYCSVNCSTLKLKEKLFMCASWTPKATVQAAVGSIALDRVRDAAPVDSDSEWYGVTVLCVAVLAIIVTSPAGAALIHLLAPRLLDKHTLIELEESQPIKGEENMASLSKTAAVESPRNRVQV